MKATLQIPERSIQAAILAYLEIEPAVAWCHRMNTGAMTLEHKAKKRFVKFAFAGCSDILGQMRDGRLLAIEVKRKGAKATPDQQAFLDCVVSANGIAGIARSVEDAQAIIGDSNQRESTSLHSRQAGPLHR